MPSVNPNGQETYWFEGAPFRGVSNNSAITGQETYWFEGAPVRFIFPVGNKGILWAFMVDF